MMHKVLFAPRVMLACFLALCYTQELRMNLLLSCIKVFGDNLEKKKTKTTPNPSTAWGTAALAAHLIP